ncbi:permease [Brevibacillus humidisoli]|uniref:permease n=1 Tax=Brevibacillus humidisoli TaxID=2895522 RepID=UPI001E3E59A0|nr:permease [Brevibacillus humidisoli]UFJ43091.1 permease [Brevibacillus humidisoli]
MIAGLQKVLWEIVGALLLGAAIYWLVAGRPLFLSGVAVDWSPRWLDVKTIFLSILLEAIPFVLMGVFFSALIQTFVKEETVSRWTPKHPLLAIPFATFLGFLFPVCECAIVPVIRRLIRKGMPVYVGIVFLLSGPVVNPIVLTSTYVAFQRQPEMAIYRGVLAAVIAALVGLLVWLFLRSRQQHVLQGDHSHRHAAADHDHAHHHHESKDDKLLATFYHAVDEFFDMGKYLLFGALVSAVLQVFIAREALASIGQSPFSANLVMMGLAYVFSLCSEADAFIAASFGTTFPAQALLAFLVFGPMIDFKNTLLLLTTFRLGFVVGLIAVVSLLVMVFTLLTPL